MEEAKLNVPGGAADSIADALRAKRHDNPVLARLRDRLLDGESKTETAITSYDRMHHRHSRS